MGPMRAAHAVATACSMSRACSEAAPSAPSAGMSRVLAKPGSGALASTATATGSFITVLPCEFFRIGTKEIGKPQAPHQNDCAEHSLLLPAPARGCDALAQAQRPAHALKPLAERDVFHQCNGGKAAYRLKRAAMHEHRLIASCDPGEAGAQVHEPGNNRQNRRAAVDLDVEAAPDPAGAFEALEHHVVRIGRNSRIGV